MDIKAKIIDILEEVTGNAEVRLNPDVKLFENDIIDSFGVVELIMAIEKECGISVPPSEFDRETWDTPNNIAVRVAAI